MGAGHRPRWHAARGTAGGQGPGGGDLHPAGCHRGALALGEELAEANFKGFGHHPLLASCDNTGGEPLAWMLRRGSAGSNTAADHNALADTAITALPPVFRRRLMITTDGAGASHALIAHLDKLAARRGYQLVYSAGWALTGREKAALRLVPEQAWQAAIDSRGKVRERLRR
jgi:hypothetical protein